MKQLFLLEDDETLGRGIALALVLLERWRTRRRPSAGWMR